VTPEENEAFEEALAQLPACTQCGGSMEPIPEDERPQHPGQGPPLNFRCENHPDCEVVGFLHESSATNPQDAIEEVRRLMGIDTRVKLPEYSRGEIYSAIGHKTVHQKWPPGFDVDVALLTALARLELEQEAAVELANRSMALTELASRDETDLDTLRAAVLKHGAATLDVGERMTS
jgi:hypothetical protein